MILFIFWLTWMTEFHHTVVAKIQRSEAVKSVASVTCSTLHHRAPDVFLPSAINHQLRVKTSSWFETAAADSPVETEAVWLFYFSSWRLLSSFTARRTELLCFCVETGGLFITLLCFPVFCFSLHLFYHLPSRSHVWQVWQTVGKVNSASGPVRPVWTDWLILVSPHSDNAYS